MQGVRQNYTVQQISPISQILQSHSWISSHILKKSTVVRNWIKIITFAVEWDETYDWVQAARHTRHDISAKCTGTQVRVRQFGKVVLESSVN